MGHLCAKPLGGLSEYSSLQNSSCCSTISSLMDNSSSEIMSAISYCVGMTLSPWWLRVNSIFLCVSTPFNLSMDNLSMGTQWPFDANMIWLMVYVYGEYRLWELFLIIISWHDWSVAYKISIMHQPLFILIDYIFMASMWLGIYHQLFLIVKESLLFSTSILETEIFF